MMVPQELALQRATTLMGRLLCSRPVTAAAAMRNLQTTADEAHRAASTYMYYVSRFSSGTAAPC